MSTSLSPGVKSLSVGPQYNIENTLRDPTISLTNYALDALYCEDSYTGSTDFLKE